MPTLSEIHDILFMILDRLEAIEYTVLVCGKIEEHFLNLRFEIQTWDL